MSLMADGHVSLQARLDFLPTRDGCADWNIRPEDGGVMSPSPYGKTWNSAPMSGGEITVRRRPLFSFSDDPKGHVGNQIEDENEDLVQPEERVKDHVEGFPG